MPWRYVATRLNGDGTEALLHGDLPLSGVELTTALSAPDRFRATLAPFEPFLDADGRSIFEAWSTAIYAEESGVIRHGAILTDPVADGGSLDLTGIGFSGYAADQPYTGERSRVQVDPLGEARHIWDHLQGLPGGDLGLVLDSTSSPVRIGTKAEDVEFTTNDGATVAFEAGPYLLNWWTHHDLGREFDDLAAATPFDYRVTHQWDGETVAHRMRLGYPTLGRRREDLRFVIGENVAVIPEVSPDEDYASVVYVLGAGEGRKMVRATSTVPSTGLRRAAVVSDKGQRSKAAAQRQADAEVAFRAGTTDITSLSVFDHPSAPVGSVDVGDEVFVAGDGQSGGELGLWVRVLEVTVRPESSIYEMSVRRVEKVGG